MDSENPRNTLRDRMSAAKFDVEHALGMYAKGFCTLPAWAIYDASVIAALNETIKDCHIYLVGFVPKILYQGAVLENNNLLLRYLARGKEWTISYGVPPGLTLVSTDEMDLLVDGTGREHWPDANDVQLKLSAASGEIDFDVKYIGQAFGTDGSRNAIDRLLKHETLQKISLQGVPEDKTLTLLLLSIVPNNQLFTVFNPRAKQKDEDGSRISAGIDKLYNTSQEERITLYEASFIRYFSPKYNKEFKESFPSTNLKCLHDCYQKDFSAVVAEICHDEIPFRLKSDTVPASQYHIAMHNLHKSEDRKAFFSV